MLDNYSTLYKRVGTREFLVRPAAEDYENGFFLCAVCEVEVPLSRQAFNIECWNCGTKYIIARKVDEGFFPR